jgi:MoxR-like ATPase
MNKATDILNLVNNDVPDTQTVIESETCSGKVGYHPDLVYGYEPDYIEGCEIKCGKHTIDTDDIAKAILRNENCLFVGETGTGKSTLASKLLDDLNRETLEENRKIHERNIPLIEACVPAGKLEKYHPLKYTRVLYNGHVGTRTEHMVGTIDIQYDEQGNRRAVRVPGFLSHSFTTPRCKLIWDEMDFTLPEVLGEAHAYLDGRSNSIDVFLNGPWHLTKQKDFSVIATANTVGAGENQMDYSGTNVLNRAFLNRFGFVIYLDYLPSDKEVDLIVKKVTGFDISIAEQMVTVANRTRAAKKNESVEYALSTRDLVSWARACKDDPQQNLLLSAYWEKVAMKYAYTSFFNRMPDESSREGYMTFFNM